MSIIQKIALSIMVVLVVFCFFLAIVGATQIDGDKKAFNKTCRLIAITIMVFATATIVFVLGFIW